MVVDSFLTIEMLKTFTVAVFIVVLITEFFKEIVDLVIKIFSKMVSVMFKKQCELHVPTKYVVFLWALFVVFMPMYLEIVLTLPIIFMGTLNSIFVTLAAMKFYESILEKAFSVNIADKVVNKSDI